MSFGTHAGSIPPKFRGFLLAMAVMAILMAVFYAIIFPFYKGHASALFMFVASGILLLGLAVLLRPSFFLVVVASFLTLGFLLKAVANLSLGVGLIEPVGDFTGSAAQWDMALGFATAGQFGGVASIMLASFIPSSSRTITGEASGQRALGNILFGALTLLLLVATGIYGLNYKYTILRIGYPLGIDIHPRVYAVAAFILTWGALLGGLALTQWLIELGRLRYASLIIVASFLGFLSSLTMGSRVQFLLYILASVCIVLWRWRNVRRWSEIVYALCVAGLLFVVSIAVVSIERNYDFQGGSVIAQTPLPNVGSSPVAGRVDTPQPPTRLPLPTNSPRLPAPGPTPDSKISKSQQPAAPPDDMQSLATKFTVVTSKSRLGGVIQELRALVLMRWVGLEGVLTAEGDERELGHDLLVRGLAEDPAVGKNGIYQKMAGDPYGKVEVFTFLTLPGVIGVASYSGSVPVIFGFVFGTMLVGHLLEWLGCSMTGNVAVGAVSGVSLAYLTVQMGFPWTLYIYALELCLACAALWGFWFAVRRVATPKM
jgi:hypothetical protein